MFSFAFSKITRNYQFLLIIIKRYDEASKAFLVNTAQLQSTIKKGTHTVTEEQAQLHQDAIRITTNVHLEIESFYLFAKILLDNVARAIEYYFGTARSLALDSHDDLAKRLKKYKSAKGLSDMDAKLSALIDVLKTEISDYRDYEIAHEKSPRSMKGTMFQMGDQSATRVVNMKVYPTERDVQRESKSLHELIATLDQYLDEMLTWLTANRTHTALRLAETPGQTARGGFSAAEFNIWFAQFAADFHSRGARVAGLVCRHRYIEPCACKTSRTRRV